MTLGVCISTSAGAIGALLVFSTDKLTYVWRRRLPCIEPNWLQPKALPILQQGCLISTGLTVQDRVHVVRGADSHMPLLMASGFLGHLR